jgi:uncharacterized protein (DUF4415 family)
MKGERITRRSQADSGKDRTDWERVRRMPEAEIEESAGQDPDNPLWTDEELASAQLVLPSGGPKVTVSIRLDSEILDYFKQQGSGYQGRINAVLLAYVRSRGGKRNH